MRNQLASLIMPRINEATPLLYSKQYILYSEKNYILWIFPENKKTRLPELPPEDAFAEPDYLLRAGFRNISKIPSTICASPKPKIP